MSKQGLYDPKLDYTKAFTTQFVNKSVGIGMKK
jgi:hypothetical protein